MAAALVGMVAAIAARHAPGTPGLDEVVREAEVLRRRLLALIEVDVEAYGRVIEARRRRDDAAVRHALVGATEVPLEIAGAGARLLDHVVALLAPARPSTLSDLGVAGHLASAALEGAALTARTNLDVLGEGAFVEDARRRLAGLLRQGATQRDRVSRALTASPA
jgi:formiminotetrahydrofolate cyclodeaminase